MNQIATNHCKIIDIYIDTDMMYLDLECHSCSSVFRTNYSTIAGVLICNIVCTQCNAINYVLPDDLKDIILNKNIILPINDIVRIMNIATYITEHWYHTTPYANILDYDGVNLGEGAERELISFVWQGLLQCQNLPKGDDGA